MFGDIWGFHAGRLEGSLQGTGYLRQRCVAQGVHSAVAKGPSLGESVAQEPPLRLLPAYHFHVPGAEKVSLRCHIHLRDENSKDLQGENGLFKTHNYLRAELRFSLRSARPGGFNDPLLK